MKSHFGQRNSTNLWLYRLLTVDIYQLDPILTLSNHPHSIAQIGGRCGTRLFLQALCISRDLNIVDADLICRRKFDWTRTGVCPE